MALALIGCADTQSQTANLQNQTGPVACATQAAELKTWITSLIDPDQKVSAPWSGTDAGFGADFESWRAGMREAQNSDPAKPAKPLAGMPRRGRLEDELATCPQATEQLKAIGLADDKAAAWVAMADSIRACECKTNIAFVKAWLYVFHRPRE